MNTLVPSEMSLKQTNDQEYKDTKIRRELNGGTRVEMNVFRKQVEEN